MRPALPAAMGARLAQVGTALVQWACTHPDAPLAEQEAAVLAAVRTALPELRRVVVRLTTADLGPGVATVSRRCPRCARRVCQQGRRPRTVPTSCGRLMLARPWSHRAACRATALGRARALTAKAAEGRRGERGSCATTAARMDYRSITRAGLPIGPGAVASSAKHAVQQRMKRPGQRWSCRGARAMLALRARAASGPPLSVSASSGPTPH
jgi:hypothetical protein